MAQKKNLGKIKGFSIQFLPYSELKDLNSTERVRKILGIILGNVILIIQGKLETEEETRLIGDTMAMIGHVKDFKGIELAVISGNGTSGLFDKFRTGMIRMIGGKNLGAVTIIGPATIVKEIKKNPKKIELLLDSKY